MFDPKLIVGEKMSPFGEFPPELILAVLKFVDLEDKQDCRLICRRWRWILDHPDKDASLISFKAVARTTSNLDTILSSNLEFEEARIDGVDKPWPKMTESEHKFPTIRKLFIGFKNSEEIVINILQFRCVSIENITLDPESFGNIGVSALSDVLEKIKWKYLSHLDLSVDIPNPNFMPKWWQMVDGKTKERMEKHFAATECFLSLATIPKLKVFRFSVASTLKAEFSPLTICVVLKYTTFIQRHSESLQKLYLQLQLEALSLDIGDSVSKNDALLASLQEPKPFKLNLEALEINASHLLVVRHLVPPCLWDLDGLTTLHWSPNYCYPEYIHLSPNPVESLIQRNQTTIIDMSLTFAHCGVEVLKFTWLEACTALRKLTLADFDDTSSVKVELPRVTSLEVRHCKWNRNVPNEVCAWITRSFRNVEIVKIIGDIEDSNSEQFEWLKNLFPLRNLREVQLSQCPIFDGLVRKFCQDKPQIIVNRGMLFESVDDVRNCIRIISSSTLN